MELDQNMLAQSIHFPDFRNTASRQFIFGKSISSYCVCGRDGIHHLRRVLFSEISSNGTVVTIPLFYVY